MTSTTPSPDLAPRHRRLAWGAALVIVLVAAIVRFVGLGEYWLNPDEGIYFSVIAWPDLARRQAEIAANAHPPLYYHLLWLWSRVSMDISWLRVPAAIAGTAGVLGVFLLGRELERGGRGVVTGLVAALLLAISPSAILLSKLIRPYTLQVALLCFALYGLVRWHRRGGRGALVTFSLCMTVALLTHYSSVFVFVAAAIPFAALLVSNAACGRSPGGLMSARRRPEGAAGADVSGSLPSAAAVPRMLPPREDPQQKKLRQQSRQAVVALALAHALPLATGLWIYFAHVRPDLAGQALQAGAFATWLSPFIANDLPQLWRQLLGVAGYVLGDAWSGAGIAALLLSLGLAIARRAPIVWVATVTAFGLAALASRLHMYPFGPARHSVYLAPFLLVPIAWAITIGAWHKGVVRVATVIVVLALVVGREEIHVTLARNKRVSTLGDEQVLARRDFELVQPLLLQMKATPGLLVTSIDSYHTLCPLWHEERASGREIERMRVFRWGQRDVLVHSEWAFSMQGREVGSGTHIYDFIAKADRVLPQWQVGAQRRLPMLFAGFHGATMQALVRYDQERKSSERLVGNQVGVKGLGVLELDAARFMAEANAELAKLRGQSGGSSSR